MTQKKVKDQKKRIYDGNSMAGSSGKVENSTGDADERTTARTGMYKRFRSFRDNVQNFEIPMEVKKIWARRRLMP